MITPKLTEEESRLLARHIVQELLRQLGNDDSIATIADKWGRYLDQWIGKKVRGALVLLFLLVSGALALKFELWSRLFR